MAYETIIYEKEEAIATLTFNRPQAMNAANAQMGAETRAAIEEARDDDEVRVQTGYNGNKINRGHG